MKKYLLNNRLLLTFLLSVICNYIFSQDIPVKKIRNTYKVVYILQRDCQSNNFSFDFFEQIIKDLPHKKRLGVESLTVVRSDNGKTVKYDGRDYNSRDQVFTEGLSKNNCDPDLESWFKCALENYNGPRDYIYVINSSKDSDIQKLKTLTNDYNVYTNPNDIICKINENKKDLRKSKESKTVVILQYQDDNIDPCISIKESLESDYDKKMPEFIDLKPGMKVRAATYPKYRGNYYMFKCTKISDFEYYELTIRTQGIPDIVIDYNIEDNGSINHNGYFLLQRGRQLSCYVSEDYIAKELKQFVSIHPYDFMYENLWDISIRGYVGDDCPDLFGPSNSVSTIQFSCH